MSSNRSPSSSYVLPVSVFLFGIVLCIAVVFNVLIFVQKGEAEQLEQQVVEVTQQTEALLSGELQKYIDAREVVQEIGAGSVPFSQILERLIQALRGLPSVFVSSLSVDSQNKLTVNLIASDYESASDALVSIRRDPLFATVFIPNASSTLNSTQEQVVHFSVTIDLDLTGTPSLSPSSVPARAIRRVQPGEPVPSSSPLVPVPTETTPFPDSSPSPSPTLP